MSMTIKINCSCGKRNKLDTDLAGIEFIYRQIATFIFNHAKCTGRQVNNGAEPEPNRQCPSCLCNEGELHKEGCGLVIKPPVRSG
jgi:hypothetical protein